ncbi:MAG: hypothetical protein ABFC91_02340 [Methanobacteriaceae archaeon]
MNRYLKIILYGFILWLAPFVVSFFIYPLKTAGSPLFESIMPLVISLSVVVLAFLYLKNLERDYVKEGVVIGVSWFITSILIDLLLFLSPSAMQMSFSDYMMDIGITYLMIPFITVGMGFLAAAVKK